MLKKDIVHFRMHRRHRSAGGIIRGFSCLFLIGLVLCCTACTDRSAPVKKQVFAMDTVMDLQAHGPHAQKALDTLEQELLRLDRALDRTSPSSVTARINHSAGQPVETDSTLQTLLRAAAQYSRMTDGIFDLTVAPLADLWGFASDAPHVPAQADIARTLPAVGMEHVHIGRQTVTLDQGTALDFGGLLKGYADEAALQIFSASGVSHGLANLGGDLAAVGGHPDGTPWKIGIQDPDFAGDRDRMIGVLSVKDAFVLTSGDYERFFEENGVIYPHIIDPRSGFPASGDLRSVTVVTAPAPGNGMLADALATALFIMGSDGAVRYWRESPAAFDMILVTDQREVLVTSGLQAHFTLSSHGEYRLQHITK